MQYDITNSTYKHDLRHTLCKHTCLDIKYQNMTHRFGQFLFLSEQSSARVTIFANNDHIELVFFLDWCYWSCHNFD